MKINTKKHLGRIWHGGDYNPEQWPEEVWDEDVALMQQAGWNIATLPVFGWAALQSDDEKFHFEWLDRILDKLHARGIGACLATATGSVPSWITEKYPDVLTVDRRGQAMRHGGRHIFCPNSPSFRRLSAGLARRMAERYGSHPALKIWHVSNEYAGNAIGGRCFCDKCASAFRAWLENRYETLSNLNQRWDTAFWGKTFSSWSQIAPPFAHGEASIQALMLDYDRFQSQSLLDCYKLEVAELRTATPDVPITTNLMGAFSPLDYHAWAREMDIVSWDCYPGKGAPFSQVAFNHSLMRGLKEGAPWLLMEQTPSTQNWQAQNALKRPGVLRLWSYQAVAHGAESVMYFQWRRTRGGIEKFHGAVVDHVGHAQTRTFEEVAALGRELEALGAQTLGGRVPAQAALLFDWETWWATSYASGPSRDLKYLEQCQAMFVALHEQGIPCDIVSPAADLSPYKVLLAPTFYMVKEGIAPKLEAFVRSGGTFVTTFFSGIADECDSVYLGGHPGPLRAMLGVWVEEVDALMPKERNAAVFAAPFGDVSGSLPCGLICERVRLEGAQTLAVYGEDFYAGEPVITRHDFGAGHAYYFASALEAVGLKAVLREVCAQAQVLPVLAATPEGLEVMPRLGEDGTELLYLLNHNAAQLEVELPSGGFVDLISRGLHRQRIELAGYGVAILRAQ